MASPHWSRSTGRRPTKAIRTSCLSRMARQNCKPSCRFARPMSNRAQLTVGPTAELQAAGRRIRVSPYGVFPASEAAWRSRLRFHAAWFRKTVLAVDTCGSTCDESRYANYLPVALAARGANFVSDEAWSRYMKRRTEGWGVEPERCTSNLLSSQALTLNLFGTLAEHPAWHARVVDRVLGWGAGEISDTRIEYAPPYPSQHLGDKTRIDALVTWTGATGRRLLAIEVKLADRYVSRVLDVCGSRRYQDLWSRSLRWETVTNAPRMNQFFRIHGLAESISTAEGCTTDERSPHFVLIHHDSDPQAREVFTEYQTSLKPDHKSSATAITLSAFIGAMAETATGPHHARVADMLHLRYVALAESESEWLHFRKVSRSQA